MATQLVSRFLAAALTRAHRLRPDPDMPIEMRDPNLDNEDWLGWKPVASTVSDSDLDKLERRFAIRYPLLYRHFLKSVHFYELGGEGVRFREHVICRWRKQLVALYEAYYPERIIEIGLVPFGDETFMDAGPVCFDTRYYRSDGECPIVFWDHEWVRTEGEIRPMFSSVTAMFRCLTFTAEASIRFMYHDDSDDPGVLPEKQALMREFLALDPEGAGGDARGYWTSWGVNPPT